ncbi:sugar transferase [Flavobacteriaceae bacterium M23B6Z8]
MNAVEAQTQKRIFDLFLSILLIVLLIVPFLIIVLITFIHFKENPFFVQERVGQHANIFLLYKFRTLKGKTPIPIANADVPVFLRWLHHSKLNELPQLWNILKGDMSFVGPRPDIVGYADKLSGEDSLILQVKPGLTGPASLKYRNETRLLLQQSDPERFNDEVIWPDKVRINKHYIQNWSFQTDIKILVNTLFPNFFSL